MGTVLLIALGVLCFVMGPALALVIVLAVRESARRAGAGGRTAPAETATASIGKGRHPR